MEKETLLNMIDKCIVLCNKQKDLKYPGEATQEQVEQYILPELEELKQNVSLNNLPDDRYLLSFGYAFKVWGWKMNDASELYLSLMELHNTYKGTST